MTRPVSLDADYKRGNVVERFFNRMKNWHGLASRAWGWIHLLLGVLVGLAGVAVIRGQAWGRFTGIALAAVSLIANFLFLPHYPLWSIILIALDVAIIWALAVYRGDTV